MATVQRARKRVHAEEKVGEGMMGKRARIYTGGGLVVEEQHAREEDGDEEEETVEGVLPEGQHPAGGTGGIHILASSRNTPSYSTVMRARVADHVEDGEKEEDLGEEESEHLLFIPNATGTAKQRYPALLFCRSRGDRKRWMA